MKNQLIQIAKYTLVLIITFISFSGCAKKASDSGSGSGSSKAIAGSWVTSNGSWTVDLSNARLDNVGFQMTITLSNGGKCTCTGTFSGDNSSGGCSVSSCNYTSGIDPTCAASANYGVCAGSHYTNNGTNLTFSGSGATYH